MYYVKNQNLKYLCYFVLAPLICLTVSQCSIIEKVEDNKRVSHHSSFLREESKKPIKRKKLRVVEYFKEHPELLPGTIIALPTKIPLYIWLDPYNPG